MSDEHPRLSSAGARRRDRMLPLLQDAIRERVRRRGQRRAVACSLLVLVVTIGLVELVELRGPSRENSPALVADRGADAASLLGSPATEVTRSAVDIQSFDPKRLYVQARQRDPGMLITTPTGLRADQRTAGTPGVVAYVTTDQLMMELAMAGIDSAVVCSQDTCTLFTSDRTEDEEV